MMTTTTMPAAKAKTTESVQYSLMNPFRMFIHV